MGKSMQDLLNEFNFQDKKFNPRNVKADMLSPLPDDRFANDVKQLSNLVKNSPNIYGKDIVRITTQGKVDTKKVTKAVLKVTGNLIQTGLGLFGKIGKAAGSAINDTLNTTQHPLLPSDLVINDKITDSGLYTKLAAGNINNQKTAVGNFLSSFSTPKQFQQNIGPAAVSVLTDIASKGIGKLANKLGVGSLATNLPKNTDLIKDGLFKTPPTFPSTDVRTQNVLKGKKGIASNQAQLSRDGGFITNYEGSNIPNQIKVDGLIRLSNGVVAESTFLGIPKKSRTINNKVVYKSTITDDSLNQAKVKDYETKYQFFGKYISQVPTGSIKLEDDKTNPGYKLVYKDTPEEFKLVDIAKLGVPKRFSENDLLKNGSVNYEFFGKPKVAKSPKNDHRKLSENVLDGAEDLVAISINKIQLMANITGLTDTPTPSWGEAKPIGSPYKFYFYESFEREISFKAQLYAMNETALPKVWQKANSIMELTKGIGGFAGGIRGSIVPLKIGNILNIDKGFITACTMTVPDISPWEIKNGSQAPFVCELDITYKVIQNTNNVPFYFAPDLPTLPEPNDANQLKLPPMEQVDIVKLPNTKLSTPLTIEPKVQSSSGGMLGVAPTTDMGSNALNLNSVQTAPTFNPGQTEKLPMLESKPLPPFQSGYENTNGLGTNTSFSGYYNPSTGEESSPGAKALYDKVQKAKANARAKQ
jgi:hypothetical protein